MVRVECNLHINELSPCLWKLCEISILLDFIFDIKISVFTKLGFQKICLLPRFGVDFLQLVGLILMKNTMKQMS